MRRRTAKDNKRGPAHLGLVLGVLATILGGVDARLEVLHKRIGVKSGGLAGLQVLFEAGNPEGKKPYS